MSYKYDVFLICPVRNATDEQKLRMENYIKSLENDGLRLYYSARDTNQDDSVGFRIYSDNKLAIEHSKEVHIFWDDKSTGSLFDLGMAFYADKKLVIVNPEAINLSNTKSFHNMISYWAGNE